MLDRLQDTPPDALLALIAQFAADEREDKIDLGVGVYRTDDGATPVFGAIKAAEQRLWEEQDSKSYLGPEGDRGFVHALMPIIFGSDATMGGRIEGVQTPGGTGAVRLAVALAQRAGVSRVFVGTPSWPNHIPIIEDVGLEAVTFSHSNEDGSADADALIAYSCDKNFGLYRDRVGAMYAKVADPAQMGAAMSNAAALARANWSMPPDHGGAAVRIVLRDEDLRQQWLEELDGMRQRLRWVRAHLAGADNKVEGVPLAHLEEQNGLFAMLPLNKDQIARLREDHAVYMAGSGRINIAGLTKSNIDKFIAALADVAA